MQGIANPLCRFDSDRNLLKDVVDAGLGVIDYNGIRPDVVFPDQIPPRRLAGPDAVDRMTQIIFGPHNEARSG
ncbi:MAG: hypothetical protein HC869_23760 [Rhodospirillales bacterium]|nr:hypothetical protein [Rhodospirillales bacterium]